MKISLRLVDKPNTKLNLLYRECVCTPLRKAETFQLKTSQFCNVVERYITEAF